jgi:holo-[acyl-carrier protein] synthase
VRPKLIKELSTVSQADAPAGVRVGLDIVQISRIAQSLEQFGTAFERKLFTPDELAYAHAGTGVAAQRLAARFAAKEAVIKALQLSEAGIDWRDMEVRRGEDGDCSIALHGRAGAIAAARAVEHIALSLSHDGDYAGAVVTVSYSSARRSDDFPPTLSS